MLSVPAPALWGQVRFSGAVSDADQAGATSVERQNPFRTQPPIQQAQFQALPPQVPDAANEAAGPGAQRATPRGTSGPATTDQSAGDPNEPAEAIGPGQPVQPIPMPADSIDDMIESSFDPGYIEQDSTEFYSTNNTFRRGYWYTQQEFVALLRTEGEDVPISADQSDIVFDPVPSTNHRPAITSKTTDHTYEPGVRLTLGRFLGQDAANRDHSLEVTFLGLFEFEAAAAIRSVELPGFLDTALGAFKTDTFGFGIIGNNPIPGFSGGLVHSTLYKTDFNSYEMNYRMSGRPLRDRIAMQPNGKWVRHGTASSLRSFIFGGRYMSINEDFKYNSEFLDPEQDSGFLNVRTGNDLVGIHGGFEFVEAYTNWTWGFRGKFGGLYNFADRRSF